MEFIWAGVIKPTESRNSSSWSDGQYLAWIQEPAVWGAYCLDGAERPGAHGKLQLARGRHGEAGLFLCKEVNLYLMPVNCTK